MPLNFSRLSMAVFSVALLGCQVAPIEQLSSSVPIYATSTEALEVADGHIGAIPVEILSESDFVVIAHHCSGAAVHVRSRTGRVGWAPVDLKSRKPAELRCGVEIENSRNGL